MKRRLHDIHATTPDAKAGVIGLLLGIGFGSAALIALLILALDIQSNDGVSLVVVILGASFLIGGSVWLYCRRAERALLKQLFAHEPHVQLVAHIANTVGRHSAHPFLVKNLQTFLRQCPPEVFATGDVLRFGKKLRAIEPLEHRTEPIALDAADPGFQALVAERPSVPDYRWFWYGVMGCVLLLNVLFVEWWFSVIVVLVIAAVVAQWNGVRWAVPKHFVVPGALIVRGKQNLIYRASECSLLVYDAGVTQQVRVLRPDGVVDLFIFEPAEGDMLLSAWLSAVPTPPPDQLQDFA